MNTWEMLLSKAMVRVKDIGPIISCSKTYDEMRTPIDEDFNGEDGTAFFAWSEKRVYIGMCNDPGEWVHSAPRNPQQPQKWHCW